MKRKAIFLVFVFFLIIMSCHSTETVAPKLIRDSLVFIYPAEAREKHLEGTVVLRVLIDEKGEVQEAEIQSSSGYDILDETALKVAETAKFKPARIHGKKSSVWITWPLVFEITSMTFDPDEWVEKATSYLFDTESDERPKRIMAQQALYYHYKDFSSYLVEHRRLFLNESALKVVLPEIRKEWEIYQNSWPLTFILFYDFITRFPHSEFRKEAEAYLIEYMKNEMFQLKVRTQGPLSKKGRRKLYRKLLSFMREHYPAEVSKEMLEYLPN